MSTTKTTKDDLAEPGETPAETPEETAKHIEDERKRLKEAEERQRARNDLADYEATNGPTEPKPVDAGQAAGEANAKHAATKPS